MIEDPPVHSSGDHHSAPPLGDDRPPESEDLWTTREVGKFLHLSAKTISELRKKGLPFVKLGGAVRFVPREIKDYLANCRRLSSHRLRQIARKGSSA